MSRELKKMILIIIGLFIIFSSISIVLLHTDAYSAEPQWFSPFKTTDYLFGATILTTSVLDWGTTYNLSKRYDEGYWEKNPIMGKHPSSQRVNNYFMIAIPAKLLIYYALPKPADKGVYKLFNRYTFAACMIAANSYWVYNNYNIGLKWEYMF